MTALTWSFAQGGIAPVLSLFDGLGFLLQTGALADASAGSWETGLCVATGNGIAHTLTLNHHVGGWAQVIH